MSLEKSNINFNITPLSCNKVHENNVLNSISKNELDKRKTHIMGLKERVCEPNCVHNESEINVQKNVLKNETVSSKSFFECKPCGFLTKSKSMYDKHCLKQEHIVLNSKDETGAYVCQVCTFSTKKKFNFGSHLSSTKHKENTSITNTDTNKDNEFICNQCLKDCFSKTTLWRHKQKCTVQLKSTTKEKAATKNDSKEDELTIRELQNQFFSYMREKDAEVKNLIVELVKNMQPNNTTNNTMNNSNNTMNNSNNSTFNLQFFLNETCKDAVNLSEFIESIKVGIQDLDNIGHAGYVEGITKIIIQQLRELGVEKRPIHCTDVKRQTLYVKEDNVWQKEGPDMKNIQNLIDQVQKINLRHLPVWREQHPNCLTSSSKYTSFYNHMSQELMGGDCRKIRMQEKDNKIMKNIIKEVGIDKSLYIALK